MALKLCSSLELANSERTFQPLVVAITLCATLHIKPKYSMNSLPHYTLLKMCYWGQHGECLFCDSFVPQHQANSYQAQLGKRKEMLDSTELNFKAQITQLEGQLDRARDTINSQVRSPCCIEFKWNKNTICSGQKQSHASHCGQVLYRREQWGSPSAWDPRAKNTGQRATKGTVLTSQSLSPWCDCRCLGSTLASWRWQDINVGNPLWRRAL